MTFARASFALAHFAGRPAMLALCAILAGMGVAAYLSGNDHLLNGANLAISIVTLMLLPVLQATQNRDSLAVHAKLDAVTPGDALNRAEERDVSEIEALRVSEVQKDDLRAENSVPSQSRGNLV